LQAIQELSELLFDESNTKVCSIQTDVDAQVHMILSQEVVSVVTTSKTLKFMGNLQGHYVVILIDSGSSHSFVNATLAAELSDVSALHKPLSVQVANGQVMQCNYEYRQVELVIQDMGFQADLKVLPLPYYDVILGIDWLELYSPMKIDWLNKWMAVDINGRSVQLQGVQPSLPEFSVVEVLLMSSLESHFA
jgi:hypothetical protein